MKQRLFLIVILFSGAKMLAQQTDFSSVVLPVEIKAKDFQEYIVQLAWLNHPEASIAQEEAKQAKSELKLVKKDWMKDLQLTFNLNEANLATPDPLPDKLYDQFGNEIKNQNGQPISIGSQLFDDNGNAIPLRAAGGSAFYPRYNFGLNVNLGNILGQKNKNQVRQHDVKIAEHKVNQAKLEIRAEALQRYQQFRLAKEILKARLQIEQDAKDNFLLVSELYKKDEKTFEDYNEASSAYYQAMEARMKAESEVLTAKFKLEGIIGLKWEQVQHPQKEG